MPGTLFVVATPLGHLDDFSPRAERVLRSVAGIACEDTRRTAKLLARFSIATPTYSHHRFNERTRLEEFLSMLRSGRDLALVSDAGTPGVADPGALLIREAAGLGIPVVPIPGPSAPIALLAVSGFDGDRFVFEGFLPHRAGERRRRLRSLAMEPRTLVFLEAPHRILGTLADLRDLLGERPAVLGRELTKLHETVLRGTPGRILEALGSAPVKGEITLVVAGAPTRAKEPEDPEARRALETWRLALDGAGGDRREALRSVARSLGMKRAVLKRLLDELGIL